MPLQMINLLDKNTKIKIGEITYIETRTMQTKTVDVYNHFWNKNQYVPCDAEIYQYLFKQGIRDMTRCKFIHIMH